MTHLRLRMETARHGRTSAHSSRIAPAGVALVSRVTGYHGCMSVRPPPSVISDITRGLRAGEHLAAKQLSPMAAGLRDFLLSHGRDVIEASINGRA